MVCKAQIKKKSCAAEERGFGAASETLMVTIPCNGLRNADQEEESG